MNRSRVSAGFMVAAVAALASLSLLCSQTQQTMSEPSRLLSTYNRYIPLSEDHPLPKYNQSSIELMRHMMPTLEAMLLVFDGQTFRAYCVGERSKMLSFRYVRLIPLMVDALRSNDPERFAPGQPVFQMVWTVADFLRTKCVNVGVECPYTNDFPPIASYATMHRNKSVLPTAQAFPNVHYIKCLYGWRLQGGQTCTWQEVDKSPHWEDLTPTVVWRGTDFEEFITTYDRYKNTNDGWLRKEFTPHKMAKMSKTEIIDKLMNHWNDISPRWRAAALTLKTKGSASDKPLWIDTMFTGHFNEQLHNAFAERGLAVSEDAPMDGKAMSKYRYQIDYGGGGGTTWEGTLTKLQMPGVLFHHETPTKDWFYDMMEPWKHYIPVGAGLQDLWLRYIWAQKHPDEAKAISDEASKLADTIMSEDYMRSLYRDLYVSYLNKVVDAYEPYKGKSWEDCLSQYKKAGIPIEEIADCSGSRCKTEWREDTFIDFL